MSFGAEMYSSPSFLFPCIPHYQLCQLVRDFTFDVSSNNMAAFTKFLEKELATSKQGAAAKPRIVVRGWEE